MNFETFLKRLKEAKDFSRIENAYSHIVYDIFQLTLDTSQYILIDTSTYKRGNKNTQEVGSNDGEEKDIPPKIVPGYAIAVPDFVIGTRADSIKEVETKGCVEVKYSDNDIENADKLTEEWDRLQDHEKDNIQRKGYLSLYKNVIYTNGWKWRFFSESRSEVSSYDFTEKDNQNNSYYGKFLAELFQYKWE